MARARLRRIETDLLGYFQQRWGPWRGGWTRKNGWKSCTASSTRTGNRFILTGSGWPRRGFPPRTFIAPSSFRFGNARMFGLGGKYGAVSFLQILSPELSDEMLADFLNTENGIVVNLHVQAIDQRRGH